jgi:hypothetical protein
MWTSGVNYSSTYVFNQISPPFSIKVVVHHGQLCLSFGLLFSSMQ